MEVQSSMSKIIDEEIVCILTKVSSNTQAMRKLAGTINRTGCVAIFINQLREKVGVMFGSPETTPGGRALKFYSSVRMDIRRKDAIKTSDGNIIGNITKIKIVKNKVAPPFKEVEFDIFYGEGISREGSAINAGVKYDVIDKSGAWFQYAGEKVQGKERLRDLLKQNEPLLIQLENEIINKVRGNQPIKEEKNEENAE